MFVVFFMFFVFILVPRHKSRESVKIGPHLGGHPTSAGTVNRFLEHLISENRVFTY
jgi:hypothetical protein